MAKSKSKHANPRKSYKSFQDLHGSKSDLFGKNKVSPQQLGHDPQIPMSGAADTMTQGRNTPLLNPGDPGHYMGDPGRIGEAMGDDPRGPEFY